MEEGEDGGGWRWRRVEYLGSVELHLGVVLDLPEPLVEALPLVGPGIPVLVGQVGEDIFGPQECSGTTEEADRQLVKVTATN